MDRFGDDFERFLDRFLDDVSSICCLYVVCCLLLAACCWLFVYLLSLAPLLFVVGCFLLSVVCRVLFKLSVCFFVRWLFVVSSLRDVHRTFAHSPGPAECAKRLESAGPLGATRLCGLVGQSAVQEKLQGQVYGSREA